MAVSYCYRHYAEQQRVSIFTQAICKAPKSATELWLATSHVQTLREGNLVPALGLVTLPPSYDAGFYSHPSRTGC